MPLNFKMSHFEGLCNLRGSHIKCLRKIQRAKSYIHYLEVTPAKPPLKATGVLPRSRAERGLQDLAESKGC